MVEGCIGELIQGVGEALLETGVKETANDTVKGISKNAPLLAKHLAVCW